MNNIIVVESDGMHRAFLGHDEEICSAGDSISAAIGELVREYPDEFDCKITIGNQLS